MASHRIGARVAGLSPAQLCAIIEAQAGASDAALRVAEEHAARLVEQPEWVLSEVLLSPDLAPHILAQLPTKEHAAKGTGVGLVLGAGAAAGGYRFSQREDGGHHSSDGEAAGAATAAFMSMNGGSSLGA
ncbi:hypothetical protein EMIHUDRAFT_217969 [Emiliania huxleyi CCMP1516]|uniref:Uncharacterized protein n=2 Tax=Emiliania huxleyi TaxID=2903 RepID=A0A0D3I9M1_EMIH1|nr:hypothetical protein EMIHUDRAFT_217969 [Emiliania huxleyi CCMP1516]EOD07956.1 hypothetical protein EMIHUDRAFT_217969 [Emiliania huxleyi CCMP1516]|eukprot:XP_005760385.1 hypothetical protein EMIHUDRAFT_217969 [Emiliania huxleyi CCMP1516]